MKHLITQVDFVTGLSEPVASAEVAFDIEQDAPEHCIAHQHQLQCIGQQQS